MDLGLGLERLSKGIRGKVRRGLRSLSSADGTEEDNASHVYTAFWIIKHSTHIPFDFYSLLYDRWEKRGYRRVVTEQECTARSLSMTCLACAHSKHRVEQRRDHRPRSQSCGFNTSAENHSDNTSELYLPHLQNGGSSHYSVTYCEDQTRKQA